MVLREVSVQVLGGDQLQHGVAEELEPLVGAQRQVVEADAAVGEGASQQADVHKLHAHLLLKLLHLLQTRTEHKQGHSQYFSITRMDHNHRLQLRNVGKCGVGTDSAKKYIKTNAHWVRRIYARRPVPDSRGPTAPPIAHFLPVQQCQE